MPNDAWHVAFLERLEELKTQYISHIANGSAADHADYKKICGVVEGISICEREFKEIISRVLGEEEAGDFTDVKRPGSFQ